MLFYEVVLLNRALFSQNGKDCSQNHSILSFYCLHICNVNNYNLSIMNLKSICGLIFLSVAVSACSQIEEQPGNEDNGGNNKPTATSTTVSINSVRPENTDEILLPNWTKGETIRVGEYVSKPLSKINGTVADFEFPETFSRPFNVILPVSAYVDETRINIRATDPDLTFAAYVGKGQPVWLKPIFGGVKVPIKGGYLDSDVTYTLNKVEARGVRGEQMSGVFELNYRTLALTGTEDTENSKVVSSTLSVSIDAKTEQEVEFYLPAGEYESGLVLKFMATDGSYFEYTTPTSFIVTPGNYTTLPLLWYRPGEEQSRIVGRVKDTFGNPIPNVVVSDGFSSVKTDRDGNYALPLSLDEYQPTFVYVSAPSNYNAPIIGGLPVFYKPWAECTKLQSVDFELVPNTGNVDRYTLYMIGDPQIRAVGAKSDRITWYSIDAMKDMFRELREHSSNIAGRNIYGMVLGDITSGWHEQIPEHIDQCKTLNFPLYHLIGNHDHLIGDGDLTVAQGHEPYEKWFGPRNYSVNLGKFHLICLDDIIVDHQAQNAKYGITDEDLEWLRGDLAYVPESTHLIVCAHSTMFMTDGYSEASNGVVNGPGYAALLKKYAKVYHFAGHSHSSFNYVYPEDSELSNMEVHVIARATGILQLNEWIADGGTPKGFFVGEIDGEKFTWKWHLTKYLTGENMCSTPPPYLYRPWTYKNGVAYIGDKILDDSVQLRTYDGGVYPDGCVYANVFLYDEKWGDVYLHVDGGGKYKMERVPKGDPYTYDAANKEIIEHYNAYHEYFKDYGHRVITSVRHLFRIKPNELHGTGRVVVTDRFGQTWSSDVKW